jgi:hypothetical protein
MRPQHFFNFRLNIFLVLTSSSANGSLQFGFSEWNLVRSLNYHVRSIHNHYILLWISVKCLVKFIHYKNSHNIIFSIPLLLNTTAATPRSQMPSIYVFLLGVRKFYGASLLKLMTRISLLHFLTAAPRTVAIAVPTFRLIPFKQKHIWNSTQFCTLAINRSAARISQAILL